MQNVARLYQVLEFSALLNFDLAILFADYVRHELAPKSHVYARFVVLTIYEGTKTYRQLLGRELQDILAADSSSRPLVPLIRGVHKALNAVATDAEHKYGDVRNGIAAHRDVEAVAQLKRLRGIGGEELAQFVERFLQAAGELEKLLAQVSKGLVHSLSNHLRAVSLRVGAELVINVHANPRSADRANPVPPEGLEWTSSCPEVALVSSTGHVVGHATGHARIRFRRDTPPIIDGSVVVLVGNEDELPHLERAWLELFAPMT
jgi:hypothetical protein